LSEVHARAALENDAADPYRHTTIRDFQNRLEQLAAFATTSTFNPPNRPSLDTMVRF